VLQKNICKRVFIFKANPHKWHDKHSLNDVLNKCNSANRDTVTDDKAPQSNKVRVHNDGGCVWVPFFLWSTSHCSMDSFWFPFDDQVCSLIFESWLGHVHFTTFDNDPVIHEYDFEPNDLWELVGKFLLCTKLYDM